MTTTTLLDQRPQLAPAERLIVALDVPMGAPNALAGAEMAAKIGREALWYKIGLGMLSSGGMALAIELMEQGSKIFLDLKLFDIGQTVENAVRGLCGWGPHYLTVHGDPQVVAAAVAGRGASHTKILAVTILTSLDRDDLDRMMIESGEIAAITLERARRALAAGADGVIASPHEAAAIRALPEAAGKLIVTPGVRPAGAALNDQKRVATPGAAIAAGADQIVVGRPILAAEDPALAARAIQEEIARAVG
ncbi:MAG: orotidine-5'-phosphate decarboxylase [Neomegalonema sp.]|nr:orotidine-5'-phosphate decarboxylase [Neomegalonema sp.]